MATGLGVCLEGDRGLSPIPRPLTPAGVRGEGADSPFCYFAPTARSIKWTGVVVVFARVELVVIAKLCDQQGVTFHLVNHSVFVSDST